MPFYQFNSFTGRIAETTHLQPLYPLAPNRLDRADPPKIMYDSPHTKPVKVEPTSKGRAFSTVPPDVLKKMEKFQVPNNIPVYLKGGMGDKVLLGATVALIGFGFATSIKMIYDLSFPKK
ncbi:cytochrome c oxidase subunit 7A, mitochondrial [Athalia rosae]|uniref:cytochrome c oxidase subunit 7A, mitochondrial n=1 Tax=Athalia rosae TaxID=37344 RepID=UPI002033C9A3|nr:cytochrome c oxidase subunit 7A, mitochondrial [Athalia rosae]